MVKVSVFYPNREGTKFDMTYYLDQHITMVRRLLGSALKGVSVEHGISGEAPGSPAPYVTTCHLLFDSVQSFQASFAPYAQEIMQDIPKYTNSEPLIQIGEVNL
ncbi:MAG: EthD family reductase [Terriglobales bacterium]